MIKAKSMFEEPIKIGLIRFADLYDHTRPLPETYRPLREKDGNNNTNKAQAKAQTRTQTRTEDEDETRVARDGQKLTDTDRARERQREQQRDFDSSHQPILVIYTGTSQQ